MTFLYLNSFIMLGTIFLLYTPFNLAIISQKPPRTFCKVLPFYHSQGLFFPLELAPYIYRIEALHWIWPAALLCDKCKGQMVSYASLPDSISQLTHVPCQELP